MSLNIDVIAYQLLVVMDSVIISNNGLYLRHLEHFLAPLVGENSKWELCYRSSTDTNVDHVFHSKCDGKNNTVTIIKKNEFVFGGFTDIPWGEYFTCFRFNFLNLCLAVLHQGHLKVVSFL